MKWKQRINDLSIKKKIIFYSYLVVTPILLLISAFMLGSNYRKMTGEQDARGKNRVQNLEKSLSELNTNVADLSVYICINSDILQILTADDPAQLNQNPQLWQEEAPLGFIQDTLAIKGYIKTLGIYPENGVQPYTRCMDSSAFLSTLSEVQETAMYQEAYEKKGKKCWKLIGKGSSEVFWANQSEKIVLYREIYDLSKKNALGYLVLGADAGKYRDLCEGALEDGTERILLLNSEGEILLACGDSSAEEPQDGENLLEAASGNGGSFSYQNTTVYYEKDKENGQTVCILIPKSKIRNELLGIAYTPAAMLLGVLIGLFPVLSFVSNVVTKPLKKVNHAMVKFQKGDFSQQVEVGMHDEVGEVAECFNQMVKDIKLLIDENYVMELREKESELMALQAQINPHFLYNTLDSLYWQAQEADNEEIAENILALSNLFRQVLGEGKSVTTVGQECRLVEEYLKVQKMRFTKRLEYQMDIEERMQEAVIPKLILQPFVENAIVHGFENTDAPCRIYVGCRSIPGGMEFVVEDTGIGMSKEQVDSILEMDDTEAYKGQRVGRYAIKNVRERLTLMYRENFKMLVESEPGRGTKITLRIFCGGTDGESVWKRNC
ncbi:MAG: sensor histidine kinase [Eubacteriales bacterium]|nr:sensor histidine kinase [Eubacteriales bacterium]